MNVRYRIGVSPRLGWSHRDTCRLCGTHNRNMNGATSSGLRGGGDHPPPPGPVKMSHKKDGCRRRLHRFHVSCPHPPTQLLDQLLATVHVQSGGFFFFLRLVIRVQPKYTVALELHVQRVFFFTETLCPVDTVVSRNGLKLPVFLNLFHSGIITLRKIKRERELFSYLPLLGVNPSGSDVAFVLAAI